MRDVTVSVNYKAVDHHWVNLRTLFESPSEIRIANYITDTLESLNTTIPAAIKSCKVFPTDESEKKVVYFAIEQSSKNGHCREKLENSVELV